MITFIKHGYGKVGYVDYRFIITEDDKARIEMCISKELAAEKNLIAEVKLTKKEIELVNRFRENLKQVLAVKRTGEDQEPKYEESEIQYQGHIIKEEGMLSHFSSLSSLIQLEHEELSPKRIANLYEETCKKIYQKKANIAY